MNIYNIIIFVLNSFSVDEVKCRCRVFNVSKEFEFVSKVIVGIILGII